MYVKSFHAVDSPDWDEFDQCVEDMWRSQEPIFIAEDMKIIEKETPFSALPIGLVGEHIVSDVLHPLMPQFLHCKLWRRCSSPMGASKISQTATARYHSLSISNWTM